MGQGFHGNDSTITSIIQMFAEARLKAIGSRSLEILSLISL